MLARLVLVLAALLIVSACAVARPPASAPTSPPVPSGITPLTVEQDAQIGG